MIVEENPMLAHGLDVSIVCDARSVPDISHHQHTTSAAFSSDLPRSTC